MKVKLLRAFWNLKRNTMERRKFLQNIFGAAVIAAIPKVVIDKIDSLPPSVTNGAVNGADPVFTKEIGGNIIYIYNKETLIGYSNQFCISVNQDIIQIPKGKWRKIVVGTKKNGKKKKRWQYFEDPFGFPDYSKGLKSWNMTADNIHWQVDPQQYITGNEHLNCIAVREDTKIIGEVYLTELNLSMPYLEGITSDAKFTGSGLLSIEAI